MENTNKVLKNDQNNHLFDQVEQFATFSAVETHCPVSSSAKHSPFEQMQTDEVTCNYVRGYN